MANDSLSCIFDPAHFDPAHQDQDYRLVQALVSEQTFLCCDESSNLLILKRLEDDCLHKGQLHPSIRDRLERVRELPHPRLATLRSVDWFTGHACMVWTYLDGITWEEAIASIDAEKVKQWVIALASAVDLLHQAGVVHGSIHGRNIIVRPDGQLWLTQVSPYLYSDPAADIAAIVQLLKSVEFEKLELTGQLDQLESGEVSLREFSHQMTQPTRERSEVANAEAKAARYQISSVAAAVMAAIVGGGIWFGATAWVSSSQSKNPTTFPSLRSADKP